MTPFPAQITQLEKFSEHFDAYRQRGDKADVYFATYEAGKTIAPHHHDTDNVGMVTTGTLELTMNGTVQRFGPGEWYHIPPHTEHAAAFPEETGIIEVWLKVAAAN